LYSVTWRRGRRWHTTTLNRLGEVMVLLESLLRDSEVDEVRVRRVAATRILHL